LRGLDECSSRGTVCDRGPVATREKCTHAAVDGLGPSGFAVQRGAKAPLEVDLLNGPITPMMPASHFETLTAEAGSRAEMLFCRLFSILRRRLATMTSPAHC
jgi:hypothetical protein